MWLIMIIPIIFRMKKTLESFLTSGKIKIIIWIEVEEKNKKEITYDIKRNKNSI